MIKPAQFLTDKIRFGFRVVLLAFAISCLQGSIRESKIRKRGQRGAFGCLSLLVTLFCLLLFGGIGWGLFGLVGMLFGAIAAIGLGIVLANEDENREKEQMKQVEAVKIASGTLISCRGCSKHISPLAEACPSCGHPQDPETLAEAKKKEAKRIAEDKEQKETEAARRLHCCPNCNTKMPSGDYWCVTCWSWSCPQCRARIRIFGRNCSQCGWVRGNAARQGKTDN